MDLHSSIHPAALDLMLGSATNAVQKGKSQYSTPPQLAALLSDHLPAFCPLLMDLTCGPGELLSASARKNTDFLLGCDVDPRGQAAGRRRPCSIGIGMGEPVMLQ